jgi:hypothetical protein
VFLSAKRGAYLATAASYPHAPYPFEGTFVSDVFSRKLLLKRALAREKPFPIIPKKPVEYKGNGSILLCVSGQLSGFSWFPGRHQTLARNSVNPLCSW